MSPVSSILALTFTTPLLLIGLAAAGIPFALHLINRVRAVEAPFPTLRFLQLSMEKTARRRRLQNWLLLLLRSLLLGLLAVALAGPFLESAGGTLGGGGEAAVILLDDSYSMSASADDEMAFAAAKREANRILSGDEKPAAAAVLTSNQTEPAGPLRSELGAARQALTAANIAYGRPRLAERFADAVGRLNDQGTPRKTLYVLSDLQRLSLQPIVEAPSTAAAADVRVFLIDSRTTAMDNAGVTALSVEGTPVVDGLLTVRAEIRNSSPKPRSVEIRFALDGSDAPQQVLRQLSPAGQQGDRATVRFSFQPTASGTVTGAVSLAGRDDLPTDNTRRFALTVRDRLRALVVCGPGRADEPTILAPGATLAASLDWRGPGQSESPWPIRVETLAADQFSAADLKTADVVFLSDVPSLPDASARALEAFVRNGGTVAVFCGPQVDVEAYNRQWGRSLLPGTLSPAVGQVGPDAPATPTKRVRQDDPLLADLYDQEANYLKTKVQRYCPLAVADGAGETLLEMDGPAALLVVRPFGRGRMLWCTTTASPRWSNLPMTGLFLPMVVRLALSAGGTPGVVETTVGQPITIRDLPPTAGAVSITPPEMNDEAQPVSVPVAADGTARFDETALPGLYRYRASDRSGAFAVNPFGPESDLTPYARGQLVADLKARGLKHVYAGTSLDDVRAQAAKDAQQQELYPLLLVAVALLLLGEAIISNRRKTLSAE